MPGTLRIFQSTKLSNINEDPLASIRLYEVPSHLNDNPQSWSEQVWQTLWAEREAKRAMLLNEELERRRLDDAERTLMVKRTMKLHRQPQPSFFSNRRSSLMQRSSQLAVTRGSGANIIDAHTFAIVPSVQAPSNWQDRGNVHRMHPNRYSQDRHTIEEERRAVWNGTKRLSAATAATLLQRAAMSDEQRKQQTQTPPAATSTATTTATSLPLMTVSIQVTPSIPLRPSSAATNKPVRSLAQLLRASTNAGTLVPAKNGALPKLKAARFKCPRCRLRSKHKTFSATIYALITEFERIQSIFQSNTTEQTVASTTHSISSASSSSSAPSAINIVFYSNSYTATADSHVP